MNKEISIIGATSALGRHLVSLLVEKGYGIHATYRTENRVTETWINNSQIRLRKLDLTLPFNTAEFESRYIIWLAHLDQGRFNQHETAVNLEPFEQFIKYSQDSGVEKFVFVSSGGSVYGNPEFLPITEDHPRNPISSYGVAKKAMENMVREASQTSVLGTAIIRPGNIYGFEVPGRHNKGIIGAYLNSIKTRLPFTLIHEGKTVRDFIHVDDVAEAILAAIESPRKEIIWNVATGKGTTSARVLEMVLKSGDFNAPVTNHIENYSSDVDQNVLSIDRIKSESDWRPRRGLESGIAETVKNWVGTGKHQDQDS